MDDFKLPKQVNYKYKVCAVIFGADESILNINLRDGFRFAKKSIYSKNDELESIFQTDVSGLQRDYITAFINGTGDMSGDVICVFKEHTTTQLFTEGGKYWGNQVDSDIRSLDNQLRTVRLIKEGPIRVKKISFKMEGEASTINSTQYIPAFNDIFCFNESYITKTIQKLHCEPEDVEIINDFILNQDFPLKDKIINTAHIFYDLSYHSEYCVGITILIVALESLFLNNERGFKKEMLSKRCAVYISNSDTEIIDNYNRLKDVYKKRSDFVHEGNLIYIRETDVLYLRNCVRQSILKALSSLESKQERISRLKEYVDENNEKLFGE